jgi:polysaccharide biosynthesis/export protein
MLFSLLLALPANAEDLYADLGRPQPDAVDAPSLSADYRVGAGDVVSIEVRGEDAFSGTYPIGTDGTIDFPHVGKVRVAGQATPQIAAELTRILGEDYLVDPQVFVGVEKFQSQRVVVLGQVDKPGSQYLTGPTTLRQVLGEAGGLTDDTVTTVQITRGGEQIETTWERLTKPGGDIPVYAGDQIYVPEGQAVFVLGAVNKPGALPYREGMTLYQAISQAQGLGQYAKINKVYILRDGARIEVRLKRILKGQESDYMLEPGDQIFIDER